MLTFRPIRDHFVKSSPHLACRRWISIGIVEDKHRARPEFLSGKHGARRSPLPVDKRKVNDRHIVNCALVVGSIDA